MTGAGTRALRAKWWILLAALSACGGDDAVAPRIPAAIVVTPNEPSIPQGQTRQLAATVVDAAGREIEGETVGFASGDSSIVAVSSTGLLTAVGPLGEVTITVNDGDLTVMITAKVILPPSSVIVTPNPLAINPTLSVQLTVVVTDASGDPLPSPVVSYTSDDPAIVTIDGFGLVQSLGPLGSTTLTVTGGGQSTVVPVTVAPIPTTLSVNPTSMLLEPGADQQLDAAVLDAASHEIPGAAFTYTSNQPSIFTVNGAGLVHALGPDGSGKVTVRSGDLVADVGVFVGSAAPGTIVATVTTAPPWGVTVTPSGKYYVTLLSGGVIGGSFPGRSFPFSAPTDPSGASLPVGLSMAVNAAGTRGYVATGKLGADFGIGVLDLTSATLLEVIPTGDQDPLAVALSPDGTTLFVGTGSGIRVIDVPTKTIVSQTGIGTVNEFTHHPTLPLLYASVNSGSVVEINATTRAITRTLPIEGRVQGTAVSPDGSELYVAIEGGDLIVWDLNTNQLKATVPGAGGFGLGMSPDGEFLYVVAGTVRIYDRASRTLLKTVVTGGDPRRIGFDPVSGTAIVTNSAGWVDFIK